MYETTACLRFNLIWDQHIFHYSQYAEVSVIEFLTREVVISSLSIMSKKQTNFIDKVL